VSFYPYAHVPWIKPSQRLYTEADLPDAALRRELFLAGRAMLGEAGYLEIGFDQYALPTDPLARALATGTLSRRFMGFSAVRADALVGLGVSAMSDAGAAYAQNEKNAQRYEARVLAGELPLQRGHLLREEDYGIRAMLGTLLAGGHVTLSPTEPGSTWWPEVRSALTELARDGLVELAERSIRVTPLGRAFLPRIGVAFDRHLRQALAA
jgi:oxygen-independent coproporphyrinogen-3 oxidase